MRKLILFLAVLGSSVILTGCEYVGMFDSSIQPGVISDTRDEPGGMSKSPEVNPHPAPAKEHAK